MLQRLTDRLVYDVLGLTQGDRLAGVLHFFIYDSVKILLLLFAVIFVIGILRTFLPRDKMKIWMGRKGMTANFLAASFGAVTPFCSCSSIPLFFGFMEMGIPLGASFSFLITSPLINEYLVVLMLGFFGWKITVLYVLSGMTIGTLAGFFLGKMRLESHLVKDSGFQQDAGGAKKENYAVFYDRVKFGWHEAVGIVRGIWLWVLAGVAIGAVIHNYVPEETVQGIVAGTGFFSVPLATLLGVPLYGSCAAIVPIAVVLFQKGIPLGTALSFMMAIAALSLPEAILLRRAMRLKLIMVFFGITALGIVITGYLFNFLQAVLTG